MKRKIILIFFIYPLFLMANRSGDVVLSESQNANFDEACKQADIYLNQGKLDSALMSCDNALIIDSLNGRGHYVKSYVLDAAGRFTEAFSELSKSVQCSPDSTSYRYSMILYLSSRLNRHIEALMLTDTFIKQNGEDSYKLLLKSAIYDNMGDRKNNIEVNERILSLPNVKARHRYEAHKNLIISVENDSKEKALNRMLKEDLEENNYDARLLAVLFYNARKEYKMAEKQKKYVFKFREKYDIQSQYFLIDSYSHSDVEVQVYQYFDPNDAGSMPVQYLFVVYTLDETSGGYTNSYVIRVEYVADIMNEYKSQMAVMAKLSEIGFQTYWETFSELKSTSYKQWINFANMIIDNKLKVGSSSIISSKDESSPDVEIHIGGGNGQEE